MVKQLDSVGSVLVFPSFVRHRVRPVTSGKRYSGCTLVFRESLEMSFEKNGYVVMKNFISKEIALTSHYLMQRGEVHKIFRHNNLISPFDNRFGVFGDEQVPNVFVYMETL